MSVKLVKKPNPKRFKKVVKYNFDNDDDSAYLAISMAAFVIFLVGMVCSGVDMSELPVYSYAWFPAAEFIIWIIVKLCCRKVYWEEQNADN